MTGTAQAAPSTTQRHRWWSRDTAGSTPRTLRARLWPFPIHPLLVAVYPILLAYSDNLAEVALSQTVQPILGALIAAVAITLVASLVLRDIRRGALVASVTCLVWFGWHYLLVATQAFGANLVIGAAVIIWLALIAVTGAWRLPERFITRITAACNVMSVLMVALIGVSIAPHELRAMPGPVPIAERPAPAPGSRDVWFLVFDRYGNSEAMRDAAGVENDLPAWLERQGFQVAHDARANYGRTTISLAATLNMTYLDDLAARLGPDTDDSVPLTDMLRDHQVGRFLQGQGYRYVHVGSWFGPTRTSAIADENPVLPDRSDFVDNMLRNVSVVPLVESVLGSAGPPAHELLHREAALYDWQELDRVSGDPSPKFVFGHVLLPHEPYVFNADGTYAARSKADAMLAPDAHREQLAYTNGKIRDLVSKLLAVPPEQQPIIIVTADEGPYPDAYAVNQEGFDWDRASDEELVTKYGVLLAMYLPGEAPADAPSPYPDMSLINTFPIVFDRYFGQDIPLFEDRSYTSRSWSRPYDLTDVTERLYEVMP